MMSVNGFIRKKLCQDLAYTIEMCNACSIMNTGFSLCLLNLLASQHEGIKYKSSYISYALYARGLLCRGSQQSDFMRSPSVLPRHMCWHYTVDPQSPNTPVKMAVKQGFLLRPHLLPRCIERGNKLKRSKTPAAIVVNRTTLLLDRHISSGS